MNKYAHKDGTPFTKEEFLQKLKTDKEFNDEFGNKGIDQISELIRLLKETPDSRRMVVSAWAVHNLPNMVLPPCHYGFQVWTRPSTREEKIVNPGKYHRISLMFNMRSIDTFLGLPFNIASYGLLLEIIAKEVNMVPDELIGNLGDTHLYLNHIEQAKEQISRTPYELPKLIIDQFDENNHYIGDMDDISEYNIEQLKLEGYQSHPSIKAPLSN
jgi:thymidylate synthase